MSLTAVPAKLPTLYQLEDDLAALLETGEGGIPEELREEYELALQQAVALSTAKRDRVGEFLRHLQNQADFAKAEAARLTDRARGFLAMKERLCSFVQLAMQNTGQEKLEGKTTTFKLKQNPPHVEVVDAESIPAEFLTHIPEQWNPDKISIARAIKAGREVAGCRMAPGAVRLEVK